MLEEHLACPKCGYDLHGIPEARCPECGFGYDAAALRSVATYAEWVRLGVAQRLIVRATIAAAFALPVVCARLGAAGWMQLCVAIAAYAAAFLTWVFLTDAYRGWASGPSLLALFIGLGVGIGLALRVLPMSALVGAFAVLASAWWVRLRNWPTLPPSENSESAELRRSVERYSRAGTLLLILATLLAAAAVPLF